MMRRMPCLRAAGVMKTCDLDHRPNHSGSVFITALPSPHNSELAFYFGPQSALRRPNIPLMELGCRNLVAKGKLLKRLPLLPLISFGFSRVGSVGRSCQS